MSPQTVTGAETACTLDSSLRISLAYILGEFFEHLGERKYVPTERMGCSTVNSETSSRMTAIFPVWTPNTYLFAESLDFILSQGGPRSESFNLFVQLFRVHLLNLLVCWWYVCVYLYYYSLAASTST